MHPSPPKIHIRNLLSQFTSSSTHAPPKKGQFLRRFVWWVRFGHSQKLPPSPLAPPASGVRPARTLNSYKISQSEQGAAFFRDIPNACYSLRLGYIDTLFAKQDITKNPDYQALKTGFAVYEKLLEAPVAKHQLRRTRQATQALQQLERLEQKLVKIYSTLQTPAQRNSTSSLLAQIDSERHLLTANLNNPAFNTASPPPRWNDAMSLRRVGLSYGTSETMLNTEFGDIRRVGAGAFNVVFSCTDSKTNKRYVYKPEVSVDEAMGCMHTIIEKGGLRPSESAQSDNAYRSMVEMPRYAARNLAIRNIDKLLGSNVIIDARIAKLPLKQLENVEEQVVVRRLNRNGQHFLSDYGLLMDFAPGHDLNIMLTQHPDKMRAVLQNGAFKRDLVAIQWMDAIAGNMDRHPGNIVLDLDDAGHYRGLKGIDNDLSLFAHDYKLAQLRGRTRKEIGNTIPDAMRLSRQDYEILMPESLDKLIENYGGLVPDAPNPATLPPHKLQSAFDHLRELHSKWRNTGIKVDKYMRRQDWFEQRVTAMGETINCAHEIFAFTQQEQFATYPAIRDYGRQLIEASERRFILDNARGLGRLYDEDHGGANVMGLPRVIDAQLAQKLEAPDLLSQITDNTASLLTQPEFARLEARLDIIRNHIAQLRQDGRVVDNWNMPAEQLNTLIRDEVYSTYSVIEEFLSGQR